MGAPEFVPTPPTRPVRAYSSPPRRPGSWRAERPGDLPGRQPEGRGLGHQGPDQGYALRLAESLRPEIEVGGHESVDDAIAGAVAVGLKRASSFGRAPVLDDVRVGLAVWGFLDPSPPDELVALRRPLFEEARSPHHYQKPGIIAAAVPEEVLRRPASAILADAAADWRRVVDVA